MTIHADGSMSRHVVVGGFGLGSALSAVPVGDLEPREDVEPVEPYRVRPLRPEPVDAAVDAVEAEAEALEPLRGLVEAPSAAESRSRWEWILSWGPGPGGAW